MQCNLESRLNLIMMIILNLSIGERNQSMNDQIHAKLRIGIEDKGEKKYQLTSFMVFKKILVYFLGSTIMQNGEICQTFSNAWYLLMWCHQVVSLWFSSHIFPIMYASLSS